MPSILGYLDHIPQGYCVFDSSRVVIFWNQALEMWTSINRDKVLGRKLEDVCPKIATEPYSGVIEDAIQSQAPVFFSATLHNHLMPLNCKDPDKRQVHQTYMVTLERGIYALIVENVTSIFHIVQDHRNTITKLKIAESDARNAEQAKTSFLANMSHEIRTPLNAIIGFCEEVMDDEDLKSSHRDMLQLVSESGKNLSRIVGDVLEYSRIEAHRIDLDPQPTNLTRFIQSIVKLYGKCIDTGRVQLKTELAVDSRLWVEVDETRLGQIISNLLSNAIKFTKEGTIWVKVELKTNQSESHIVIAIEDTGIGIDLSKIERLLMPFEQGDLSTTKTYGGTGLGLSIVKGLIEQMSGVFDVESKLGEGARVTVSIPTQVIDAPESVPIPIQQAKLLHRLRVLVAEDRATERRLIAKQLSHFNTSVDFVENGKELLQISDLSSYELILMDCKMPVMNGYHTTALLRERYGKGLRIVALTASVSEAEIDRAFEAGMDQVLAKPVSKDQLRELLSSIRDNTFKRHETDFLEKKVKAI
ncbi:ATP-binding protein [Pseudobacteriovorax antillogorgiicola]|uniref:histidine kinase n=1 Tax=Pseudobacteriovorax antillogorgiicola TaxID=1513793 RepID=A0A1Y6CAN6_9BACT|nr:ATP-binding protein [Pseudobacteriovorax antillogorgiicola]TCS48733.1 PAS domain-containing protein [Pseudobacteriovorax antillogorgiicola]SMF54412.1 PAS fold-containing protein [Pseudobacteriovorax antillogorgiicola]